MTDPTPPTDLGDSGRALWSSLVDSFDFEDHELALITEAARVKDRLDALDAVVRAEGVTATNARGEVKTHPALSEARAQEIVLTRLIASLRLPDEDGDKPQHRGGGRGVYSARRAYGANTRGATR